MELVPVPLDSEMVPQVLKKSCVNQLEVVSQKDVLHQLKEFVQNDLGDLVDALSRGICVSAALCRGEESIERLVGGRMLLLGSWARRYAFHGGEHNRCGLAASMVSSEAAALWSTAAEITQGPHER